MTSSPPPDDLDGPPTVSQRKLPPEMAHRFYFAPRIEPEGTYALHIIYLNGEEAPEEVVHKGLTRLEMVTRIFAEIREKATTLACFTGGVWEKDHPPPFKMLSAKMLELIKTHAIEPGDVLLVAPGKD